MKSACRLNMIPGLLGWIKFQVLWSDSWCMFINSSRVIRMLNPDRTVCTSYNLWNVWSWSWKKKNKVGSGCTVESRRVLAPVYLQPCDVLPSNSKQEETSAYSTFVEGLFLLRCEETAGSYWFKQTGVPKKSPSPFLPYVVGKTAVTKATGYITPYSGSGVAMAAITPCLCDEMRLNECRGRSLEPLLWWNSVTVVR